MIGSDKYEIPPRKGRDFLQNVREAKCCQQRAFVCAMKRACAKAFAFYKTALAFYARAVL